LCTVNDPYDSYEFPIGLHEDAIRCSVTNSAGNSAETTFSLDVQYRYDVNLIPPKGRARAGSTVPLDWQYFDDGVLVDSSLFNVGVIWEKTNEGSSNSQSCSELTPEPDTDGSSFVNDADSGKSNFRYSSADNLWQFSWQTPDVTGWHRISIVPPGGDIEGTYDCIELK
jgi:hypothetical protein